MQASGQDLSAGPHELRGDLFEWFGSPAGDHDAGPRARVLAGDRSAQTRPAAGHERDGPVAAFVRVQAAVTVGLTPLLLMAFGGVSLLSPLANAFAIPLFTLLVVPTVLLGACAAAVWVRAGEWVLVLGAGGGIGLAAIQVNVQQWVLVADMSDERTQPLILVNAQVVEKSGSQVYQESSSGSLFIIRRTLPLRSKDRWRCASSTRSTTSTARCLSITCPH